MIFSLLEEGEGEGEGGGEGRNSPSFTLLHMCVCVQICKWKSPARHVGHEVMQNKQVTSLYTMTSPTCVKLWTVLFSITMCTPHAAILEVRESVSSGRKGEWGKGKEGVGWDGGGKSHWKFTFQWASAFKSNQGQQNQQRGYQKTNSLDKKLTMPGTKIT